MEAEAAGDVTQACSRSRFMCHLADASLPGSAQLAEEPYITGGNYG